MIGVVLLVLTLLLSFTGYLLPWDQLSYWAVTVGTNIAGYVPVFGNQVRSLLLGGNEVERRDVAALLRPAHLLHPRPDHVVIAIHIWRVRKDGFAVVDRKTDEPVVGEQAEEPMAVHDVDA